MDRKDVQGLSLEDARKKLEELERFAPPKRVVVPALADQTATHVIERRRLKGKHYTKEILLSIGLVATFTFFAWFFLRAQAQSSPRPPAPEPAAVAPQASTPPGLDPMLNRTFRPDALVHEAAPRVAVPPPTRPPEQSKPQPKPAPAPASEPTDSPELDPLLNRTFRK